MSKYLCVSASILADRYHGEEWPPAPARLLKAMLAASMTGGYRRSWADVVEGFRWLERQPPPRIVAQPFKELETYRIAVPNNDLDVAAKEWQKGKRFDAAQLKTMKTVAPKGLPEAPHVHYLWPIEDEQHVAAVRQMAQCLHTLGWGVDMAYADARVVDEPGARALRGDAYVPAETGPEWQVPVEGFLDDLQETYKRFCSRLEGGVVKPDVRPMVYGVQPYRREGDPTRPVLYLDLCDLGTGGPMRGAPSWRDGMVVAAWLRHATAKALRQEGYDNAFVEAFAEGHHQPGQNRSDRLSYVPVPSIGHEHVQGGVRRAAIVGPLGSDHKVMDVLRLKLRVLTSDTGTCGPECRVVPATDLKRVWDLYLGKSRIWRSVTPVVLHGHNGSRGSISLAKTEKLLWQAFEEAGLPVKLIEHCRFQAGPLWAGTGAAQGIRVPVHLAKWPRCHVEIEFREEVSGPMIAGIGRHYGIGLFAGVRR